MCLGALGRVVRLPIQHVTSMLHLAAVADEEVADSFMIIRTNVPEVGVS